MVPLKATLLPMLINASRPEKVVTTRIATTGIVVRLSICYVRCEHSAVKSGGRELTMLRARANGSPRSRAKDHVIRDAAARQPIALQNSSTIMMLVIIVAPSVDPVACSNICMNGGRGDSSISVSISPALKRTAHSMPNAKKPLMAKLMSIDRATSILAFRTSSDI